MNRRKQQRRQSDIQVNRVIEGVIMLFIAVALGGYTPVGIVQFTNWAAPQEIYGPDKAFIFLFTISVVMGGLGAVSLRKVRSNKHAWWIAPTIGFNTSYSLFLLGAFAATKHDVYLFSLIAFIVITVFIAGAVLWEMLPEAKPKPGMIVD